MSGRTYALFIALIGAVCGYVVIRRFLSADSLTLRDALIQGFFVGYGLALVTIDILARMKMARINGWVTAFNCGLPGNGIACSSLHRTTRIFRRQRTTGTQSGDYLITGPSWKGQVPNGMKQIESPNNSVFVIGRVLVHSDSDLPTAHALTKQIQIVPRPGR